MNITVVRLLTTRVVGDLRCALSQLTDYSRQVGYRTQLMASRLLPTQVRRAKRAKPPGQGGGRPTKKCVSRIQRYFILLIVWKPNKSDSRHLPETTISPTSN